MVDQTPLENQKNQELHVVDQNPLENQKNQELNVVDLTPLENQKNQELHVVNQTQNPLKHLQKIIYNKHIRKDIIRQLKMKKTKNIIQII